MQSHTTRSFSALPVAILNTHDFLGEIALLHVEVKAIHGNKFNEGDVVSLLCLVSEMVSEHEASFLRGVRMEIDEHQQTAVQLTLLYDSFLCRPDSRLLELARVQVEPVQILSHCVETIVAAGHAIRVQNWNDLEHVRLTQHPCLLALQTETIKVKHVRKKASLCWLAYSESRSMNPLRA